MSAATETLEQKYARLLREQEEFDNSNQPTGVKNRKRDGIAEEDLNDEDFVNVKSEPVSKVKLLTYLMYAGLLVAVLLLLKLGEGSYLTMVQNSSMLTFNPYHVLNVKTTATAGEVKKAYRALSLEYHPDKFPDCDQQCEERFNNISQAYKILSNPENRKLYDLTASVKTQSTSAFTKDMHPFEYEGSSDAWKFVESSLKGYAINQDSEVSGVWAVLVTDSSDDFNERFLPIWSDMAARFYGSVSFMRIDARKLEKDHFLPLAVRVTPMVFVVSEHSEPRIWGSFREFTAEKFNNWLVKSVPRIDRSLDATNAVAALHDGIEDKQSLVVVYPDGIETPSSIIKSNMNKYSSVFDFVTVSRAVAQDIVSNIEVDESQKAQLSAAIDSAAKHGSVIYYNNSTKSYGVKSWKRGVWTIDHISIKRDVEVNNPMDTQPGKAMSLVQTAFDEIVFETVVNGSIENSQKLCGDSLSNEKVCLIGTDIPTVEKYTAFVTDYFSEPVQRVVVNTKYPSLMKSVLNSPTCDAVVMDRMTNKYICFPGDLDNESNWSDIPTKKNIFPRMKRTRTEEFARWVRFHPIITATTVVSTVVVSKLVKLAWTFFTN